ncbi:MAG: hypothetical protein IKX85_05510, partial [Clostridia bacterium]|nr:hypothetical protein [Clostridia bacterium]
ALTSAAFYAPEKYRTGAHDQKAYIQELYDQEVDVVTVDAYGEIRYHTDEYIYFRTDHHWAQLGAYYAYIAFCETLGLEPYTLDQFEAGQIEGNFVGSLYSYTSGYSQSSVLKKNPDTVYYWRPVREYFSRIYPDQAMTESKAWDGYVVASSVSAGNKYLAFIAGDNPLMKITSDAGTGKKIAVIKESYGNAFVPFLVNHYDEIYVIDPRKWNRDDYPRFHLKDFVADNEIDQVLVIDYPLVISNQAYINYLNNLLK